MVDIKRQDITLQDWTKGISADEFAWGSYFYSDGIQTWYSTKWFKLWHYVDVKNLNNRTAGRPIAVCPCKDFATDWQNFIVFTKDWKIEMWWNYNWSTSWDGDENGWGCIWQDFWNYDRVWGYVYWDYALILINNKIIKVDYKNTYDIEYWEWITNPRFENSAAGWTVGTGWALTDDWMRHSTGNTGTLQVTWEWKSTWIWRFAVKIVWATQGSVTISTSLWWDILTTEAGRNWWFTWWELNVSEWQNVTITITPSSDFNWTIEAVNFHVYDMDAEEYIQWLTNANKHMAIEWAWDIYISCGNTIDILSTIDWSISTSKKICRDDEEIVAMTQQADSLIIRATNGINSSQYYWNWVDSVASECIKWRWQVIKAVTGTETISYVLAWAGWLTAWNAYRLYSVSWYQRSLIASNAFKVQGSQWNLEHYHPSKKFAFNDVQGSESMCIYLDNLYIPWCDWIYQFWQTLPWLSNAWSRPITYENGADKLFVFQNWSNLSFTYRINQRNYYTVVRMENYTQKWYLITDSLYWDKLGTRKALEKLKIWYKSLSEVDWCINIYAIVDDDYFWRFDVTWVTNRPAIWDVYTVARDTTAEVIRIDKTSSSAGTITFRTLTNEWSLTVANNNLSKVSGSWDASLSTNYNYDNMVLVKTITNPTQCYGSDLIFGKDFVDNYMPYWHKIQLVVELVKNTTARMTEKTPEIYEISMASDITDITL